MCGIAGILRIHPPGPPPPLLTAIPEPWLDILDESIKHRGPDGRGRFRDRTTRPDGSMVDVALVHRRLSIIDHAGGFQPMVLGSPSLGDGRGTGFLPVSPRSPSGLPEGVAASRGGSRPGEVPLLSREGLPYSPLRAHTCPRCAARGATTLAVVFNGCIYNHRDLRKELEAAGHEFFTDHSDTEVLLHAYSESPRRVLYTLNGMFAYAIWDSDRARMFYVRDRFGEKPLYTCVLDTRGVAAYGTIQAFSSSVPSLALLQCRFSPAALVEDLDQPSLAGWVRFGHSDRIVLDQIDQLRPGSHRVVRAHFAHKRSARLTESEDRHYFFPKPDAARADESVTPESVDAALRGAVHRRMESDAPIGCLLSGGIDSSLVAWYAAELHRGFRSFTVRMPHAALDESRFAAKVARLTGSDHETVECSAEPTSDLVRLVRRIGLPLGDSSLLANYWVSRAARQRVKVALSGEGGDELFLGYQRYTAVHTVEIGRRFARYLAAFAAPYIRFGVAPHSRAAKAIRLLHAIGGDGYPDIQALFPTPLHWSLGLGAWCRERPGPAGVFDAQGWVDKSFDSLVNEARRHDVLFYLPDDLLRKVDSASMSEGLEVRAPFLDPDVAELALGASPRRLMPHNQRKGLLRAVARKYFPPDIVDRPKQGFAIPIGDWFRSDYGGMRQLLLDHLTGPEPFGPDHLGINSMINMAFVHQMLKEHDAAGEKSLWPWRGRDHSQRLYMLLVLSIWAKWLGGLQGGK